MKCVLIDNLDSFTYNIKNAFIKNDCSVTIINCNDYALWMRHKHDTELVIIGPGPGSPIEKSLSFDILDSFKGKILGICLGHQIIAAFTGSNIKRAITPVHGKADSLQHDSLLEFSKISKNAKFARYNSLIIDKTILNDIYISAYSNEGEIMAIRHNSRPITGWQFHPESILSTEGDLLINSYLMSL